MKHKYQYYVLYYDKKAKDLNSDDGYIKAKSYGKAVDKILDSLAKHQEPINIVIDGTKIQIKEG